jgi:hypothetical protein
MNKFEWTELFLKFCAISLFIGVLSLLPSSISESLSISRPETRMIPIIVLVANIFILFLAYLIWRKASVLSLRIWANSETIPETGTPNIQEIHIVVFSGIGLFIVISTLPELIRSILSTYSYLNQNVGMDSKRYIEIISHIIKLCFGIWALLGSKGIIRILGYLKHYPGEDRH